MSRSPELPCLTAPKSVTIMFTTDLETGALLDTKFDMHLVLMQNPPGYRQHPNNSIVIEERRWRYKS